MDESLPDRDVEALIQGYLEGDLSAEDAERLDAALRTNPGWAKVLLDHLRDHQVLGDVMRESEAAAASLRASRTRLRVARRRVGPTRIHWLSAAAAAVVLAGLVAWLTAVGPRPGTGRASTTSPADGGLARTAEPAGASTTPEIVRLEAERRRLRERLESLERERARATAEPSARPADAPPAAVPERDLARIESDRKAVEETAAALASVENVEGIVWLASPSGERSAARAGAPVFAGGGVATEGMKGRAAVVFPDRTRVELGADTRVARVDDAPPSTAGAGKRLQFASGLLVVDASRQPKDRPLVVITPHAEAVVQGTRFTIAADASRTSLQVERGEVRLGNAHGAVQVRAGQASTATAAGAPAHRRLRGGVRVGTRAEHADGLRARGHRVDRRPPVDAHHVHPPREREGVRIRHAPRRAEILRSRGPAACARRAGKPSSPRRAAGRSPARTGRRRVGLGQPE
jgi:ferric-dicitrate binding protein FerR (iron transport regulator)